MTLASVKRAARRVFYLRSGGDQLNDPLQRIQHDHSGWRLERISKRGFEHVDLVSLGSPEQVGCVDDLGHASNVEEGVGVEEDEESEEIGQGGKWRGVGEEEEVERRGGALVDGLHRT